MKNKYDLSERPKAAGEVFLDEVALSDRWSGISVKTLQANRAKRIGVPYVKIGRAVRYRLADILSYEEERTCGSANRMGIDRRSST